MQSIFRSISLVLAVAVSAAAAADTVKDSVASELAFIKRVFETGYAPSQWKKEHLNWDIATEYNKALAALNSKETISAPQYRRLISDLLTSTHDYHVGFHFLSTEAANLPFQVAGTNGKYFVVWIDTDKLDKNDYPIQVGDQVITWAGRPTQEVVAELLASMNNGVPTTDQRLAEMALTRRSAARGMEVPQGRLDITFQRDAGGKAQTITRQFTWNYTPESIDWNPSSKNIRLKSLAKEESALGRTAFPRPQMAWGEWSAYTADAPSNGFAIGRRKSFVPSLGQEIWHSQDTEKFDAYIYRNEAGKLVGYVRIPSYMEDVEAFKEFKKLMGKMQGSTDALVIDEVNNPGGSVFYVLALMSVLSDQPIKVPDHHIALWPAMMGTLLENKDELRNIKNDQEARKALGETWDGYPIDYQFVQGLLDYTRDVEAAWKAKSHLTPPLHLDGVDKVNPDHEVNYTKPILVLINELDFSGGDFFPAILQDNKRVKVFGQRTSGAGGYVLSVQYPSALGLSRFSFTGSLARRIDNQPIENLGVTPDIPYTLTEKDYKEGFVDYKTAINKAVQDMIK